MSLNFFEQFTAFQNYQQLLKKNFKTNKKLSLLLKVLRAETTAKGVIVEKLGWIGTEQQLKQLYEQLNKKRLLKDIDFPLFRKHFLAGGKLKSINWFGPESKLFFLFEQLINEKLIVNKKDRLTMHFVNQDGKEIKAHQLAILSNHNKDKPLSNFKDMTEIIFSIV